MTKTLLLSLAAAALVASSLSFAPAAEAGGVRLNFGGPLGSFVARPTPGYGGSSSYASKKDYCPPKMARSQIEADKPHVKVAKNVERAEPRVAHVQSKPARQQVASIEKPAVAKATPVTETTATTTTASTTVTAASGSQSLAAGGLPAAEKLEVARLTDGDTVPAVPAPDAVPATTQDSADATKTEPAKAVVASGPQDCKKFIPAVGVTVTVGCDK